MADGKKPPVNLRIAMTAVFASLIALGTILSFPAPPPLYEITWAPAIYLSLAVLSDRWTAFSATAIGGFIGEAVNVAVKGGSPIYPFGIVWARAPEVVIVAWAARKGNKWLAFAMVVATVFETLAFFFPDWLFYTYGLFSYGSPESVGAGFTAALPDLLTMIDLAWIPVAFGIIYAARPAFRRLGFQTKLQEPKAA
jgi:hypothetical protein